MSPKNKKIVIGMLTFARIIGIPFIGMFSGVGKFIFVNFLFITDYLDGYLARKYEVSTKTGALLDLIADKLLVSFLLITAYFQGDLSLLLVVLIIGREVLSMVLRYVHNARGGGLIPASIYGKFKTALQFVAFDFMLLNIPGYEYMFWVVVILGYYSLNQYFKYSGSKKGE